MNMDNMNFALCCDNNYLRFAMTTATSVALAHSNESITIHILGNGLRADGIAYFIRKFTLWFKNTTLLFYDVSEFESLLRKSGFEVNREIGISTYIRLFLTEYLPLEIRTVLYLDCDILVMRNLRSLFQVKWQDKLIAAVKSTIDIVIDGEADKDHVNAGVVLFNLELMRKENTVKSFIDVIVKRNGHLPWHDGTVINDACQGRIHYLPLKYNAVMPIFHMEYERYRRFYNVPKRIYSHVEYEEASMNPAIIHLVSWVCGRPWEIYNTCRFKETYFRIEHILQPETAMPQKFVNAKYIKRKLKVWYHRYCPFFIIDYIRKWKKY